MRPTGLLDDAAEYASPAPVSHGHVHFTAQHARYAVGEEKSRRQTLVDVLVQSRVRRTDYPQPRRQYSDNTRHADTVNLRGAHQPAAYCARQAVAIAGHSIGLSAERASMLASARGRRSLLPPILVVKQARRAQATWPAARAPAQCPHVHPRTRGMVHPPLEFCKSLL